MIALALQQVRADYTDPDDPNLVLVVEACSALLLLQDRAQQLVAALEFRAESGYRYCKACGMPGGLVHLEDCEVLPVKASLAAVPR